MKIISISGDSVLLKAVRGHILYRLYDDSNELLYIGITKELQQRLKDHSCHKVWWSEVSLVKVEEHSCRTVLSRAERKAIQNENPKYNVQRFYDEIHDVPQGFSDHIKRATVVATEKKIQEIKAAVALYDKLLEGSNFSEFA